MRNPLHVALSLPETPIGQARENLSSLADFHRTVQPRAASLSRERMLPPGVPRLAFTGMMWLPIFLPCGQASG